MLLDDLHELVSGAYELEEWHVDGAVLRPPQVVGRFVLVSGTVTTVFHNRAHAEKQITAVLLGKYVLDKTAFAYGYHDTSIFTETPSELSVSHKPLWDGMRSFAASMTPPGAVQFSSENGQQGFTITLAGITYSENGQTLRVWRRMAEK